MPEATSLPPTSTDVRISWIIMQTFRLLFASLRRRTLCIGVLAVVAAGLASSAPLATGTVRTLDVDSASLGGKLSVAVYVPGTTAPPNGWPVLYLLHGLGGCEDDWLQLGSIRGTLDRLIGAGRIRPMMVVMPGAGSSWYVDSGRFGGPGNY